MTESDLYDALTDIDGVGEATAHKIFEAIEAHETPDADVSDHLSNALAYHDEGRHAYAEKFVRQALAEL